MVADCGATCARWLLCLANFVFVVVSGVVLVAGSWLAADKINLIEHSLNITSLRASDADFETEEEARKALQDFVEPAVIDQAAYILIALGAFVFIISFLGYCGAIKESRVLLTTFGIFLIIVFALEITVILICTIYKSQASHHSRGFLKTTLTQYYTAGSNKDAVTVSWDMVMAGVGCCGVDGYQDFRTAKKFVEASAAEGLGRQIPEACCKLKEESLKNIEPEEPYCISRPTIDNSFIESGCYSKVASQITENVNIVIGVVVVVVAIQLVAIILSFCLCRAVGQDRDIHYKY